MKIFQWSFNNKYLSKEIEHEFNKYKTNAPYSEKDIDYKSLLEVVNTLDNNNKILILSLTPIYSGTISLIFLGKINNNTVIIKLLRKNIDKKINSIINFLFIIAKIFKFIPIVNLFNFNDFFQKNKKILLGQIDFINEIKNIKYFYNNFKKNKYIKCPQVYSIYTSRTEIYKAYILFKIKI